MAKSFGEMLCLLTYKGVVVEESTERTALRELRDMVDRGIIVSRGETRGLRYFLP